MLRASQITLNDENDYVELTNFNKKKREQEEAIKNNQRAGAAVGTIDSLNLAAIFTMFLQGFMHKFLEELGKYFMFPIAAAASVIQAILAWRQAYLDGGQSRSIVHAVVETVTAVAVTTAVIGALVATSVFAVATPIIFTAVMAGKTLYHAGSAMYYAGKYAVTNNFVDKTNAINNGIAATAGLVATAAVTGVFLLGKIAVAAVGIVAGIFGAAFALYNGITSFKKEQAAKAFPTSSDENDNKTENTLNAKPKPRKQLDIVKGLGIKKDDLRQAVRSSVQGSVVPVQASPSRAITPILLGNDRTEGTHQYAVPRGLSRSAK